jgi:hypothetical protein
VRERLLARDAPRRIECQHPREEIDGVGIRMGIDLGEWDARTDRQRANVVLCLRYMREVVRMFPTGNDWKETNSGRTNTLESVLTWGSEIVQDLIQLVDVASD